MSDLPTPTEIIESELPLTFEKVQTFYDLMLECPALEGCPSALLMLQVLKADHLTCKATALLVEEATASGLIDQDVVEAMELDENFCDPGGHFNMEAAMDAEDALHETIREHLED